MSPHKQDFRSPVPDNLIAEMRRTGHTNGMVARGIEVSERQLSRWRGGITPQYRFVARLADYFGRTPEWFYADHGEIEDNDEAA